VRSNLEEEEEERERRSQSPHLSFSGKEEGEEGATYARRIRQDKNRPNKKVKAGKDEKEGKGTMHFVLRSACGLWGRGDGGLRLTNWNKQKRAAKPPVSDEKEKEGKRRKRLNGFLCTDLRRKGERTLYCLFGPRNGRGEGKKAPFLCKNSMQ